MKNLKIQIRRSFECIVDHSVKNGFFVFILRGYYQLALAVLVITLKSFKFDPLLKVYLKHSDWIVPVSDIDLVLLIKSSDPKEDAIFFKKFWKVYSLLRVFFPIFCHLQELRFIRAEELNNHPLTISNSPFLLLTPNEWKCLYSHPGANDDIPFSIKRTEESTRHLFLFNKLQGALISGQTIIELRFIRLSKMMIKIIQHLIYLQKDQGIDLAAWENQLKEVPSSHVKRRESLVTAFQKLIMQVHRTHCSHFNLADDCMPAPHGEDDHWLGNPLKGFIKEGKGSFGDQFKIVVLKQISEYSTRAFLIIDEQTDENYFKRLMLLSNQHHQKLVESKVRILISTDKILTSQFFSLWSPYALEGHIILARESYNPDGVLKIKKPLPSWVLWKIRNSISIFEEYYLPLLTSPLARGTGKDFCKIYERPEVEMLFHYFYYLKDRESYEDDLKRVKGDSNEILCITASKYADEIGIGDWHPYRYASAYPYVKGMLRRIDQMACEKSGD